MCQDNLQGKNAKGFTDLPTRERVLEAAEVLFAEKGYGDTSVRDITVRAASNLASVNYHFGGKENLYTEVFRHVLTHLREYRIRGLDEVASRPDLTLETVLETFSRVFLEPLEGGRGRIWVKLFLWEMLEPHLPPRTVFEDLIEPITEAFTRALARTTSGLSETSLRLCLLSLVGQLIHLLQMSTVYARPGLENSPGADLSEDLEHIVRFTAAGIRDCAARDAARNAGNSAEESR